MNSSSFLDRFEAQSDRSPDAVAVSFEGRQLTYRELDALSSQLARLLIERGVVADAVVAICTPRSLEMAVCVLAVLKAGAGYLPLDPSYPHERLTFMLDDSRASLLLTLAGAKLDLQSDVTTLPVSLDAAALRGVDATRLPRRHRPDGLAYAIYTSGSTGKPKGVAMVHRALDNLIAWQLDDSQVGAGAATLQFAPLSFDVHFQEMFGTWCAGGRLVLVREELRLEMLKLLALIAEERIERLFLPFIALQSLADIAVSHELLPSSLREVITAGEQLQITRAIATMFSQLPQARLFNHYGPSETHVVTSLLLEGEPSSWPPLPAIGSALPNVRLLVLDEGGGEVAQGGEGELFVGGVALARGYLFRPELTSERFVERKVGSQSERFYRTGDLVKETTPGVFQYLGRLDGQVKVRGYRIELGEIEVALSAHESVREAAVAVHEPRPGDKRLVAYLVHEQGADSAGLRGFLEGRLPDYMMPSAFVSLPSLPRTPSGKVDKRSLPAPTRTRPALAVEFEAPSSEHERRIEGLWSELLAIDGIGVRDNFFELGGNSLLALKAVAALQRATGQEFPIVRFFERPTIAEQAAFVADPQAASSTRTRRVVRSEDGRAPVAIIGMAGRFPGAESVDALFTALEAGVDAIERFVQIDPAISELERDDPSYVAARGVLRDADKFDAAFFGISPIEAQVLDPQQRILLELAWNALENAGYAPNALDESVGVYAGTHNNTYYMHAVVPRPDAIAKLGALPTMVASEKDYVATRIAHRLDLRGPALSIHTACSTSLVAIATAVQHLRAGMCDVALAGGAALTVPQQSGHLYQEGGMLSRDGHTRSFDADATGTVFSDGAAMVVLKRLDEAVADRDHIYAVIRGVALNNDGGHKASFTAPSVEGQADVIAMAHEDANVSARELDYVEAHGTATPLGDPIEVEALTRAFRRSSEERGFCGLGSIKSNLGHLTAAAGVAGVVKVALSLERELLPPSINFQRPNPNIPFASSPFFVVEQKRAWPRRAERKRLAGVSSFGVGGTNAHVILEEAPSVAPSKPSIATQLFVVSAKSESALTRQTAALAEHLRTSPPAQLADAAYTLAVGRAHFAERRAVVARSAEEAASKLLHTGEGARARVQSKASTLAFMFPGQGAQYPAMGQNLYASEPTFRLVFDECAERLLPVLGRDLRQVLYATQRAEEARAELKRTEITQSALFSVEYALARTLLTWGIAPRALIGHSVGEFVAACLSGVFELEAALTLVATRGKLMQSLAPGSMISVRESAARIRELLPASLDLACENTSALCVVAGPRDDVQAFGKELEAQGILSKELETSHAFHSRSVDPAVAPFREALRKVKLSAPRIPILSTATGALLRDEEALDPDYWAQHMRRTVRFAAAVDTLLARGDATLLEVGPGKALTTFAGFRAPGDARPRPLAVTTLPGRVDDDAEWQAVLNAVGRLWTRGEKVDFRALYGTEQRHRIALPGSSFERTRHWLERPQGAAPRLSEVVSRQGGEELTAATKPPIPASLSRSLSQESESQPMATDNSGSRRNRLVGELRTLFEETSGMDLAGAGNDMHFLELGIDSLMVTQLAARLKQTYKLPVSLRQLMEDSPTFDALAAHIDGKLPPEAVQAPVAAPAAAAPPAVQATHAQLQTQAPAGYAPPAVALPAVALPAVALGGAAQATLAQQLIQLQIAQLSLFQQLLAPGAAPAQPQPAAAPTQLQPAQAQPSSAASEQAPAVSPSNGAQPALAATVANASAKAAENGSTHGHASYDPQKAFGAIARIYKQSDSLTPRQQGRLKQLEDRYCTKTAKSKAHTQEHRAHHADPRVVTGFKPRIKELIYPIVTSRANGCRLWDLDGNEYIDALNGFGSNFFGYSAPFIADALKERIGLGYEIGPQTTLAGESAALVCELTGMDRAAFCNTGSEAVMGALRIARTVTSRSLVVAFSGSYHGIFDEVIVRDTKSMRSVPAAPGILPEAVHNILVLEYGTDQTLAILRERADELAAVLVEPVQSRRPDFQPKEFIKQVREITRASGTALIFDEVITGFRAHPAGAQHFYGIEADLTTYGKVVGGGMPIGVIAGRNPWMDALDGGQWQFGDDSVPTAGVTYFAGTFVRHPLTMAAAHAALKFMKAEGPALQERITANTTRMANELNAFFASVGAPLKIKHFASLWKTFFTEPQPYGELLFCYLRDRGLHIWDGFPCFLTMAHGEAEIAFIISSFKEAVREMQAGDFLPGGASTAPATFDPSKPPVAGARLGRDTQGNPAWFVPNPESPGKFLLVS